MMDTLRTTLRVLTAALLKREYDAQCRATDKMVADLDAIVANMKRAREDDERSETWRSA
jgi:hypothetical protein